jgi:hypothetical protein
LGDETGMRTNPPSNQPNNQDVFVWALYLLGGADKDVDVEEIYIHCFKLAEARFAWRTRPDLPDYKKLSKALQSVEAKTHAGLLLRPHEYSRRLSVEGVRWVETYKETLIKNYSQGKVQASFSTNQHERRRQEVKSDLVWRQFLTNPETLTSVELASVMNCTAASTDATWKTRINELRRASDVLGDEELMRFADFVHEKILGGQ